MFLYCFECCLGFVCFVRNYKMNLFCIYFMFVKKIDVIIFFIYMCFECDLCEF